MQRATALERTGALLRATLLRTGTLNWTGALLRATLLGTGSLNRTTALLILTLLVLGLILSLIGPALRKRTTGPSECDGSYYTLRSKCNFMHKSHPVLPVVRPAR